MKIQHINERYFEIDQVREAINTLIARKEQRINALRAENKGIQDSHPVRYRMNKENIRCLEHSIDTLIELKHTLRLCGCPDDSTKIESPGEA